MIDIINGFFINFFEGLFSLDIMIYPIVSLVFSSLFSLVFRTIKGERVI